MTKTHNFQSPHAFADEALAILSLDVRIKNNIKYLGNATKLGLIKRYPRGKKRFVYDRESLKDLAAKLDHGHVLIDTASYSFQFDFETV